MLAAMLGAAILILARLVLTAGPLTFGPAPCPAPADLGARPDVAFIPATGGQAPDLAPSPYVLPRKIEIPLELYLPPPAPSGTKAELGHATIDRETGATTFDGAPAAPGPGDCR
jgi:hypothetical protein